MPTRDRLAATVICLAALAMLGLSLAAAPPAGGTGPASATDQNHRAAVIVFSGEVNDYSRNTLYRNFEAARAAGAGTIILQLDTYGGLVTSALDISRFLKRQNDLHVIAFVNDKAISAGAAIALACDEIVMDPSATMGDCAPIVRSITGDLEALPPTERAKMTSPVLADFRDSADRHGYNVLLAEAMVEIDHPVTALVDPQGKMHFALPADLNALLAKGYKPAPDLPDPVNGSDELLTVNASHAVKLGLATGTARDADALAASRGLQIVATLSPGWGEAVVEFLGSAVIRGILIGVFMLALQVAMSAPGHGAAEAVALLTLGTLLTVPLLTGYALWWEVLLVLGGLGLVAFELFVFPGHLVSLILGSIMVLFGLIMTFAGHDPGLPPWMPATPAAATALRNGLIAVASAMTASVLLGLWLSRYLPTIPYFRRLVLTAVSGDIHDVGSLSPMSPQPPDQAGHGNVVWPSAGMYGRALCDLTPGGLAEFIDADAPGEPVGVGNAPAAKVVSVVAESGFIPAGTVLVVRQWRGSYLVVRAVNGAPSAVQRA